MSPLVLSRPDSIERFHSFIFADPISRAPYLYGLKLSSSSEYAPNDDPRFIDRLVAIMDAATHLEHLYFPTTVGRSICAAVTKMSGLRELHVLSGVRRHTQREPEALNRLLATLRCPLQHLTVENSDREQISASFLHSHLHHFGPTLKYLSLDLYFNMSPSSETTPFTALRSLHIVSAFQSRFIQMDVLLRLFPNLDDTLLHGFTPPADQYSLLREQSKEAQKDYT